MTKEELISNLRYTMKKHENDNVPTCGTNISIMCKDILDYLEQEPCTVDAKPTVHAHWIVDDKEGHKIWHCHCSNCKKDPQDCIVGTDDWWMVRLPYFCPNCGAKMRKGGVKK